MCGIFIEINKNNINKERFISLLETIKHRGPDDSGFYFDNNIGIGHNRLKITGERGTQPFVYNDIVSVVNGEFYGYKTIKKNLKKEKFSFQTDSDSEIIIPLYLKYGINSEKFWNALNGEFSFAIYDKNNLKIHLGRDPYGIKPLYYYYSENSLYISSEIKSFLSINKLEWNEKALKSVLTMQYHNTEETLFKNVFQVEPGEFITINIQDFSISKNQYWSDFKKHYDLKDQNHSFMDLKNSVYETLRNSISKRIENQKNIACTLSGGIDSSIIYGISSSFSNDPINAYTISFDNGGEYDELKYAEKMCQKYNGNFNPIFVSGKDLIDNFENAIFASEQVSINGHLPSKYILYKHIKENGHKVSLSGEGADELFLGYSHFKSDLNLSNNNQNYLKGLQYVDNNFKNDLFNLYKFVPNFLKAKFSLGNKFESRFLKEEFITYHDKDYILSELYNKYLFLNSPLEPVQKSSLLWSKICLSNYILNGLGDKMEMHSSIEGRVPFLDKDVINLAHKIPTEYKLNVFSEKHILKEAFKHIVTDDIYHKTKHPFLSPSLLNWSDNSIYDLIQDILNSRSLQEHDFISKEKLKNTIEILKNDKDEHFKTTYEPVIMMFLSIFYLEKNFIGHKNV